MKKTTFAYKSPSKSNVCIVPWVILPTRWQILPWNTSSHGPSHIERVAICFPQPAGVLYLFRAAGDIFLPLSRRASLSGTETAVHHLVGIIVCSYEKKTTVPSRSRTTNKIPMVQTRNPYYFVREAALARHKGNFQHGN